MKFFDKDDKNVVGTVLQDGMTEVVCQQPADPVDFLGKYLLNWVKVEELKSEQKRKVDELNKLLDEETLRRETELELQKDIAEQAAKQQAKEDALETLLKTSQDTEAMYKGVCAMIENEINVNCYIGEKNDITEESADGEPAQQINYIHASEANSFMLNEVLPRDKGLTWSAWEPVPLTEEEEEEGIQPSPPEYIYVDNVARKSGVHFFKFGRLGSYLAVPFVLQSSLHPDAKRVLPTLASEDGDDENSTDKPKENSNEADDSNPGTIPVEMIFCVDNMGIGVCAPFGGKAIDYVLKWVKLLCEGWARAEKEILEDEMLKLAKEASENSDLIEKLATDKATELESLQELASAGLSEEEVKEKQAELKLRNSGNAVQEFASKIRELKNYRVPPKPKPMKVLECALYCLKYSKKTFYDSKTNKVDWSKMRRLFDHAFFRKLEQYDPTAKSKVEGPWQKVDGMKKLIEGLEVAEMNQLSVAYGVLLEWSTNALESKAIAIAKRKEEDEEGND